MSSSKKDKDKALTYRSNLALVVSVFNLGESTMEQVEPLA